MARLFRWKPPSAPFVIWWEEEDQDRGHPETGCKPFQCKPRRYSVLAADRDCRAAAPDRHISFQARDPALAAGNRALFRRPRPHDRPPCGAKDHWSRDHGRNIVGRNRAFEAHAFGVSLAAIPAFCRAILAKR